MGICLCGFLFEEEKTMEKFIDTVKQALAAVGIKHIMGGPNTVRFYKSVGSSDPRAEDWHLCMTVHQLKEDLVMVTANLAPDNVDHVRAFMDHIKDVATLLALTAPTVCWASLGLVPTSHDKDTCEAVAPTAASYVDLSNMMLDSFKILQYLQKAAEVLSTLFPQLMDIIEDKIDGFDAFYVSVEDAKKAGAKVVCVNADDGVEDSKEEEKPATPFGPGYFGPAGN